MEQNYEVYQMKKEITTIKISKKVVGELYGLKIHPRQSYEEVIVKLLKDHRKGKNKIQLKNK